MPPFQLEISILLAASALASLFITSYASRTKTGRIQLPTSVEDDDDDDAFAPRGPDPFDVFTEVDFLEGYPIEPDAFWKRVRARKLAISLLLAVVLVLDSITLGWSAANYETDDVVVPATQVFFSISLLVIAVRSIRLVTTERHAKYILHLTVLSTLATVLFGFTAILPDSRTVMPHSEIPALRVLNRVKVLLLALVCLISITTRFGPPLHYRPADIYSDKIIQSTTNFVEENVSGEIGASILDRLLFSYTTKVVWLGNIAESLEVGDLPIVPAGIRASVNYSKMKIAMRRIKLQIGGWSPQPGSGWGLGYRLLILNIIVFLAMAALAATAAVLFYTPTIFLKLFISYLEEDIDRKNTQWGWVYVTGMFFSNILTFLVTGQLWSISTTTIQVRLKTQLNSILFAKTLVKKDAISSAPAERANNAGDQPAKNKSNDDEADFSSKAQIMTLMTTDVDRIAEFAWHVFALVDSPIEILIGTIFLYQLLGVSCFFGLGVTCLLLPLNHLAGKIVITTQENLMKARDERVALMNEILGAIRMLKFMAWERNFETKVMKVRRKELKYQKVNYLIETYWSALWNASPLIVTLVTFWHFAVIRGAPLTPSVTFTAIMVFNEMRFALNALPETFINILQSLVSLRRVEKYLNSKEIDPVPPIEQQSEVITFQSCTVTWSQDRASASASGTPSAASTPRHKFMLMDLNLTFPPGSLSLVCGKLGSGKTLLLLSLLGESDVLAGQIISPRSPPDTLLSFTGVTISKKDWVLKGVCAYVSQVAWLQNASIKENILFNLPYDEERYNKTLEVCALISDLEILEDGDEAEIGERGVNLSGGQKARVSLARAVYSRASLLLLDDVLSAVDAHTAHHLYNQCLKGELMEGRTVILVSHHVQLCASGASYIVALDNGQVKFSGDYAGFQGSGVIGALVQTIDVDDDKEVESLAPLVKDADSESETASTIAGPSLGGAKIERKPPRKLIEEEKRAVGRVHRDVWELYFSACGQAWYWVLFITILVLASASPVLENGWLRYWTSVVLEGGNDNPVFFLGVYAAIAIAGTIITTLRFFVLYDGSLRASSILYKRLLESVLFANVRFHDTVSRGRLLNRFGKDFEVIDSNLSDNFGRSFMYALSALTTVVTLSVVGGPLFIIALALLCVVYFNVAKVYGQTSRDMRRLDSVTRSPLYSIYGETIAGVTIIRAFGASSKFLRDMIRCVDTNANPYYWMWGVNRWLSVRFNLLSATIVGITALLSLITPGISASFAGFALAFASTITHDLLFMVRRFVGLEQSMVALERVKEYSELKQEAPEYIEPRPPSMWPSAGAVECEDLVIRYAPELPNVLHKLNFSILPGEKIGILGRTGSGKSTLALSFFRFVEPTEGRIIVDGIDIATVGLTDLRSRLTIIPQDPTILSGTLRSTLDVFDEYEDVEIFEALRRVHLIPATEEENPDVVNENVFRNLDYVVSEGGENFSTGEKQLLCMARAILKKSKILLMDEATASVDYATDELIGNTIRTEFTGSTILTIAHRLRTVIEYDRVMLLDQGNIIEFDRPSVLLQDPDSKFSALCRATGKEEFATLKKMAGVD